MKTDWFVKIVENQHQGRKETMKSIMWFVFGALFAGVLGQANADNGTIRAKRIELYDDEGNIRVILGPDRAADYGFVALVSEDGSRTALFTDWFIQWTEDGKVVKEVSR